MARKVDGEHVETVVAEVAALQAPPRMVQPGAVHEHDRAFRRIDVVRRGAVRRAKLYYLRGRTGKSARIAERRDPRPPKGSEGAKAEKSKG